MQLLWANVSGAHDFYQLLGGWVHNFVRLAVITDGVGVITSDLVVLQSLRELFHCDVTGDVGVKGAGETVYFQCRETEL